MSVEQKQLIIQIKKDLKDFRTSLMDEYVSKHHHMVRVSSSKNTVIWEARHLRGYFYTNEEGVEIIRMDKKSLATLTREMGTFSKKKSWFKSVSKITVSQEEKAWTEVTIHLKVVAKPKKSIKISKSELIKGINSELRGTKIRMKTKFILNDSGEYQLKDIFVMKDKYSIYGRQKRTPLLNLSKRTLLEIKRKMNNQEFKVVMSMPERRG